MSWKQKLQANGWTEKTAPKSIKKLIKELEEMQITIQEGTDYLATCPDEEKEAVQSDIQSLTESIAQTEAEIEIRIDDAIKNREKNIKLAQSGKAAREAKAAEKARQQSQPNTPPSPQTPPPAAPNGVVVEVPPTGNPTTPPQGEPEPKKRSGLGFFLFAAIVAGLTYGAVNIMKNRE